jgi:O-antigen ligase
MPVNLKALIIVVFLAAIVFRVAGSFAPFFISTEDFARRRNAWYLLTATGLLAPNFWIFAIIAIPTMIIAGRKDTNPSALYLMLLQVVPPVNVPVPMIGMASLFNINNGLLLCFCVMTPVALRSFRSKKSDEGRLGRMDYCLLVYGVLTAILYIHTETPDGGLYPGSPTESLRRLFLFMVGKFVPYFAISRTVRSRELLVDTMATYCLDCAILSLIAIFESAKGWLLFGELAIRWGGSIPLFTLYVTRGSSLRAMASTGHAMALGHTLVIALGFWLYLMSRLNTARSRVGGVGIIWSGLMAAYTRGAWIGGVLVYFAFAALNPRGLSKVFKATALTFVVAVPIWLSPLGDRIVNVLPFLGGKVDTFNIIYRERLFERSWQVIQESPLLGDQAAMLKMQDLRQGEGIIDLVNTYMGILLENGFVGMTLFLLFILAALGKAWSASRRHMSLDPDLGLLGASLVSCIATILILIWNESFGGVNVALFYALAALAVGYASLSAKRISQQPIGHGGVRD